MKDSLNNEERKFLQFVSGLGVPAKRSEAEQFEQLKLRMASQPGIAAQPARRLASKYAWIGAAASVLLLIGLFIFTQNQVEESVFATLPGEVRSITLPDASVVSMQGNSEVRYNAEDWATHRNVQLKGKAFFDVARGKTFTVLTETGTVEVLGTSFDVNARNRQLVVACKTGKVVVQGQESETNTILEPGMGVTISEGGVASLFAVQPTSVGAWQQGEFVFEDAPLPLVVNELMSQYGTKIILEPEIEAQNTLFTGQIQSRTAMEALTVVALSLGLEVSQAEDGSLKLSKQL